MLNILIKTPYKLIIIFNSMKKNHLLFLSILLVIEMIYFNILFDYILLSFLFTLSLGIGGVFRIKSRGLDTVLIKIALGLGSIGFFVWLTTLYDVHHKSLFLILGILIIFWRNAHILSDFQDTHKRLAKLSETHAPLLALLIIGMILYTIPGSYPIQQWDSLAKHIVIPSQILNHGYYDYNVVESIIFGDYAIFINMLYFFLMALGGTKALVLLNVIISLLTLAAILRISSLMTKRLLPLIIIAVLYLTTPLIYTYSTTLCVDLYPVYFITIALLLIQYDKMIFLSKNLPFIALLFGFAFFSKQMAFYLVVPISIYIIILLIRKHKYSPLHLAATIGISIAIFFLPFLPNMLVIWYKTGSPLFPFLNGFFKSPFMSPINFQDPYTIWHRFLGFDFHSLWSIVFQTSRNTEYMDGGTGYHLLLLPLALILWPLLLRNRRYFAILVATLGSYWISVTFFNPNIRYFLGAIIFAIPVVVITLDILFSKFKNIYFYSLAFSIFMLILLIANIKVITNSDNQLGLKKIMLIPNNEITLAPNQQILRTINQSDIYLLSNNDNLRGTYRGHYYTLTWYNTYISEQYTSGKISPSTFLSNFNYYLIDKGLPLNFESLFSTDRGEIREMLELIEETPRHKLYKIKRVYTTILEHNLIIPISVNVDTPKVEPFAHTCKSYKIYIDAIPTSANKTIGRFQINWLDKNGAFLGSSIVPFDLKSERTMYESSIINNIPEGAAIGQFYITSHTPESMFVYGYKLIGQADTYIDKELKKYGQKLMPVYK